MDRRPEASTYERYVDTVGWVSGGSRGDHYCPTCKSYPDPRRRDSRGATVSVQQASPLPSPVAALRRASDPAPTLPRGGGGGGALPPLASPQRPSVLPPPPLNLLGGGAGSGSGTGGTGGTGSGARGASALLRTSPPPRASPVSRSALDEALECCLCLGRLQDPCTLPTCGHSFCRACLLAINPAHNGSVQCPLCRAPYPRKALLELAPSHTLRMVLEIMSCASPSPSLLAQQPLAAAARAAAAAAPGAGAGAGAAAAAGPAAAPGAGLESPPGRSLLAQLQQQVQQCNAQLAGQARELAGQGLALAQLTRRLQQVEQQPAGGGTRTGRVWGGSS